MVHKYQKVGKHYLLFCLFLGFLLSTNLSFSQCPNPSNPPGNPDFYRDNNWRGYVYNTNGDRPTNGFNTNYRGYIDRDVNFDQNFQTTALNGPDLCSGPYSTNFAVRLRMRDNMVGGNYQITVGGDDGFRLSVDGGETWITNPARWSTQGYTEEIVNVALNGNTFFVLEYFQGGGPGRLRFNMTQTCTSTTTPPTSITGTTIVCSGNGTVLTAAGGNLSAGGNHQWGTGTIVGQNTIPGATAVSYTIDAPAVTQSYWVRRADGCVTTEGVVQLVAVEPPTVTAPTAITGNINCTAAAMTLTAVGGAGSAFQWGTGNVVGDNTIGGATTANLTIANPNNNTTYWVRRTNAPGCTPATTTAGVTATIATNTIPGNQTSYGVDSWIGYVYNISGLPPPGFNNNYRGFVTRPVAFDQSFLDIPLTGAPNLCGGPYTQNFAARFRMTRTMPPGLYSITVGGDDGFRLSVDGGTTWITNPARWNSQAYITETVNVALNGATNFVLEYFQGAGGGRLSFDMTLLCASTTTPPTSITGTNIICPGNSTTLTAIGGVSATGALFQWGIGNILGENIIPNANSASITVTPTSTTTYWVRRVDNPSCITSGGPVQVVAVEPITVTAPTAIAGNVNCGNGSMTLTATGGEGSVFQWGTGTVVGTNPIPGATNVNYIITTPASGATYWVNRTNAPSCPSANTLGTTTTLSLGASPGDQISSGVDSWIGYIYNISGTPPDGFNLNYTGFVTRPFTFNQNFETTALTGAPNLCGGPYSTNFAARFRMTRTMAAGTYAITVGGDDGFRLSVNNGSSWITSPARWAGQAYITETVTVTYSVATTVSFVLEYFQGSGGGQLSFDLCSTAPTGISGNNIVCLGSPTTLTAVGGVEATGVPYRWGTGTVIGDNVIAGTTASIVVFPATNTTYWVQRMNLSTCAATSGTTQLVTVSSPTVGGTTTGAQTICANTIPTIEVILTGMTGSVIRWEKSTDSAFSASMTTAIAATTTTLTAMAIGMVSAPTYIRAVVRSGTCAEAGSTAVLIGFSSTTWDGTNWSNVAPNLITAVIINGNYNTNTHGNLNACSVSIAASATLTVTANNFLVIQNNLENSGTINIINNGSLVQISNTAVNTGTINYTRTATAEQFDVIYWSSPVATKNLSAIPKQSGNTVWQWNPTVSNGNGTNNFGNWEGASGNMTPGRGYAARVPNSTPTTPSPITTTFVGVPNNGLVEVQIARASNQATLTTGVNGVTFTNFDDNWNLIGNPYPSAISAIDFLTLNTNLVGSISLWTHGSSPFTSGAGNSFYGGFTYNYSSSDYLVFNSSGPQPGPGTFAGLIAAGQGFFVTMIDGLPNTTQTAFFNNSMRSVSHRNDQFFRTANKATNASNNGRIWLDLIANNRPDVSRILVGYIDGATNANDRMFDANGNYQSAQAFYSLIENEIFGIQGKALPFDNSDVIPLGMGLQTINPTGYKIAIAATDGLFANNGQTIYLEDKLLNIIHNLSISPYDFTATRGISNNRFVLRYTTATLSLNNQKTADASVLVFKDNGTIKVVSPAENIASVTIFDILGRSLYTGSKVNSSSFESTTLAVSQQTLIVKVVLENGTVVSRKIVY